MSLTEEQVIAREECIARMNAIIRNSNQPVVAFVGFMVTDDGRVGYGAFIDSEEDARKVIKAGIKVMRAPEERVISTRSTEMVKGDLH